MLPNLAAFRKDQELAPVSFELSRDWVREFVDAVGDEAIACLGSDAVPPMAVAALSVRALLESAALAPGAIHAGQELSFSRGVVVGETLVVRARIVSRGERAGWVLMGIGLQVSAQDEAVMSGRATLTFPAEAA